MFLLRKTTGRCGTFSRISADNRGRARQEQLVRRGGGVGTVCRVTRNSPPKQQFNKPVLSQRWLPKMRRFLDFNIDREIDSCNHKGKHLSRTLHAAFYLPILMAFFCPENVRQGRFCNMEDVERNNHGPCHARHQKPTTVLYTPRTLRTGVHSHRATCTDGLTSTRVRMGMHLQARVGKRSDRNLSCSPREIITPHHACADCRDITRASHAL